MDIDLTHKIDIASKRTLTADFRLTLEDILKISSSTKDDKFYINGGYYRLRVNKIEFNPLLKEQVLRLNFESIYG